MSSSSIIPGGEAHCSWCAVMLTDPKTRGLCDDCEEALRRQQCVLCEHGAEFVCARCGALVCLRHHAGRAHELCLCSNCATRAVRLRPWRELAELGLSIAVVTAVGLAVFGFSLTTVLGLGLATPLVGAVLGRLQDRSRQALLSEVAGTPPLAAARLHGDSGARWRGRLEE